VVRRCNRREEIAAPLIFVDTSALYALLLPNDLAHGKAVQILECLQAGREHLVTTNYVVLETGSLLQSRSGVDAVKRLNDLLGVVDVHFIDESLHASALQELFAHSRRQLSLVDCSSFVFMRRAGIRRAFAFDDDFKRSGFELL
jgi:predicted nucleic acid-binding protein